MALLVLGNDLLFISQNIVANEVFVLGLLAFVVAVKELLRLLANDRLPIRSNNLYYGVDINWPFQFRIGTFMIYLTANYCVW